jgi:hypothetical protein
MVEEKTDDRIISTKDLCEIFSITDRTVRRWKTEGCPCEGRNEWSLFSVVSWWYDGRYYDAPLGADDEIWGRIERRYHLNFDDYLWWVQPRT